MREDALDMAQVATELKEWRAVDRAWADEQNVQQMRWQTAEGVIDPVDPTRMLPDVRRGPYGSVERPDLARPRARDVDTELAVREDIERNAGVFRYEPASGGAARLRERLAAAPAWLADVIAVTPVDLATLGRTAALLDDTLSDDADYALIARADEAHTHYLGIRPVLTFWDALRARGGRRADYWPLAQ